MSWIWEQKYISSDKNKSIHVQRFFGQWSVSANGCLQTGSYTNGLWRCIFGRLEYENVRRVLVLGLGAGGVIPIILKKYPKAHIVAVEWDEEMIALTRQIQKKKYLSRVECHLDDAQEFMRHHTGKYDLIIVDLFTGKNIPELLLQSDFLGYIRRSLSQSGSVLANAFLQERVLDSFAGVFSEARREKYLISHWGVYRNAHTGVIGDSMPTDFVPFRACKEYLEREATKMKNSEVIDGAVPGIRSNARLFYLEKYLSDTEPSLAPLGKPRLIVWRPISCTDVPKGWMSTKKIGIADMIGLANVGKDYVSTWSDHAIRHRDKWIQESSAWIIKSIPLAEYLDGYVRAGKPHFLHAHAQKKKAHSDLMTCWGAYHNGELAAGLSTLDIPEVAQSVHFSSFIMPQARKKAVGYGLIDHWFCQSLKNKIRYLNFGLFWTPGDPKSWKNFSQFKAQFGTQYIRHPRSLIRLII